MRNILRKLLLDNFVVDERGRMFVSIEKEEDRIRFYNFFNKLGIKVYETNNENHNTMRLVDICLGDNMYVSYTLWHVIQANKKRDELAYSYYDFEKVILLNDKIRKLWEGK